MGVADGVGGWAEIKGANPALYSRKIMHYVSEQLEAFDDITNCDYDINDYYTIDPKKVLTKAFDLTKMDAIREGLVGSTTAMVCILRDDELRVCTIGDCGLLVIRDGEAIFRSEEQQHSFNFPYQLGTGSRDTPGDALAYLIKVREGDLVVLGTDGIFDNVFDDEILEIVKKTAASAAPALLHRPRIDPQRTADALLAKAREVAEDSKFGNSPFQARAIQEGLYYQGGKLDDATVLTGLIRLSEDSPDRR
ncbi:phosphatase 2C-like domain-containing protein [Zopfochytrium polystomum]|nr:phosphatase 2C-like domain-containing protein [Zopfochytrium polystomum]